MKTSLKILIVCAIMLNIGNIHAQKSLPIEENETRERKLRPFRIGAKVGFPNIIGGNLEYVTPLLNEKLAVSVDYSTIKSDWLIGDEEEAASENNELDYTYIEGGLNYYFFKPGRGLYGGLSYGNINIKGTVHYEDSRDIIDTSHGSVNIKLGAKLGGLFYFRPEVGYSFSPLPDHVEAVRVYNDGSRETMNFEFDSDVTPYNLLFSGLMANIGIGFAF
ncbi:hypothetical protein LB465_01715 [Salegentibacter sp. LM13S]|uniref:hypothetical protein n=1 Tax=Salegentibacter lacus TaxID=2873599 RepID=UPI001CCFA056|nr:hypothetical protein [Salegentibacter lacus]MBZ9629480.1 hypothetical protein [Salegentibacter lacus]